MKTPQKQNNLDYIYIEDDSYLDSREYKAYAELVLAVVTRSGAKGVTYGELKRKLGKSFIAKWTADVMDGCQAIGAPLTRYRMPELAPVKTYTSSEIKKIWNLGPLLSRPERF